MATALLIANPRARRATPAAIRAVGDVLAAGGWHVDPREAQGDEAVRRLAREAAAGDFDLVVVMGGDGTVIGVASELVGVDLPIAIVPAGTGNLLAGNLGLPVRPVAAARAILRGRPRRIDLGRVEMEGEARHFAIACGSGFDARVMAATHPERKRRWGQLAYFATAVALGRQLACVPFAITIDGVRNELEAAEVIVANFGGLMPNLIGPRLPVIPDDGLLDIVALTAHGPVQGLRGVWEALTHPLPGPHPGGRLFRASGREIRVEAWPPQPVELDGDIRGATPFTATVLPRTVSVIVP